MLAPVLVAAIIVEDQAALRATPSDASAQKAQLSRGDWVEVRGDKGGFLQVYDHRRERPGYVRAWQVRRYPVAAESAPALKAVVEFLRDTPGAESLGIGYTALYLRAAPAVESDVLDALGGMAERLARRASLRRAGPGAAAVAAHLDVAQSYGVRFVNLEAEGEKEALMRVCYDGEAFRRVLAMASAPAERARAALGLTVPECTSQDRRLSPAERQVMDEWRLSVLDRADPAAVPAHLQNRLRMRRAEVLAELVFQQARRGDRQKAAALSELAVRSLALVSRPDLQDEDAPRYEEAAVRVAAARWAGEPERASRRTPYEVQLAQGQPGETCVRLTPAGKAGPILHERCTYGLVWPSSVRVAPRGTAVTLAVQPLAGWVELWVFRPEPGAEGAPRWRLDTLPPAPVDPDLGYTELAGFSPDGSKMLVAREARVGGGVRRSFQVLRTDTLALEKQARTAELLLAFRNWQSADWRGRTLALR